MSIPHIMLVKLYRTGAGIEYRVECRDFNPDGRWEVVGSVVLVPELQMYQFQPTAIWRKKPRDLPRVSINNWVCRWIWSTSG